jgi:hypothetical protein
MAKVPAFPGVESTFARVLLLLLIPGAVLIGLYGRFKGLGTWPLGVDEFYISRSIDRVLSTGIPGFACGGYYTRGLLYQYLVAALRMGGLSPEFAGRFVAGLCSLLVLPSAYLLGKRAQGPLTGWLTLIILCVSIWEIEMARFGRMYAPFQAVFACYLLFYLRYTVDGNAAALRWMVVLSVVGVLTWEGGTLLGAANLFAVIQVQDKGRLERGEWRRLGGLLLLLALLYAASRDLRGGAGSNDPMNAAAAGATADRWLFLHSNWLVLRAHYGWAIAFLAPLAMALASLRFIGSHRNRWMTFAGLSLILLAALGHAFTVVLGLLALMLLSGVLDWHELTAPRARSWVLALLSLFLYWLAYDQWTGDRSLQSLFGFPDVVQHVAWPLGRAVPVETLAFALCGAFWFLRSMGVPPRAPREIRSLMGVLILMVLAVAAIPTERIETRYIFFLYPLLIVLAVAAVLELAKRVPLRPPLSDVLLVAAPLLCFAVTEDFQPRQLTHIDSAASNFRLGMRPARADHYYPRNDMRGVADWLAAHVETGDVVVSGIPNLDQYDRRFDYFYLDDRDNRYDAYVCADGRTDRWTNHRVIFKLETLSPAAVSGHHLYATVYPDVGERLQQEARSLGWTVTRVYLAQDGKSAVLSIRGGGRASPTG